MKQISGMREGKKKKKTQHVTFPPLQNYCSKERVWREGKEWEV